MLSEYERNSLRMIFESVKPEKVSGILETLLESFENQYTDDYSIKIAGILTKTIKEVKAAEKKPS